MVMKLTHWSPVQAAAPCARFLQSKCGHPWGNSNIVNRTFIFLWFLLLAANPAIAQEGQSSTPIDGVVSLKSTEQSPGTRLSALAETWKSEDLGALVGHFGEGRVTVELGSLGRSGEYGAAQAHFLFRRLFRRIETTDLRVHRLRPAGENPHATFEWSYIEERSGTVTRAQLFVALRREAGTWVVDEIRVAPR